MKILVTGGCGFIGSHLVDRLLADDHRVVVIDDLSTSRRNNIPTYHDRLEFWRHDVCLPFHVDCERIYHLACPASPVQYSKNPVRTIKTCVLGTMNALELARETGARLLFSSTSEVYGDPLEHPQRESYFGNVNPLGSRSMYDEGKRCAEALIASWGKQYGTNAVIARIFNTYGPRMDLEDGRLIPSVYRAIKNRDFVPVFGSGEQTRSWCYVADTVRALVGLMESGHSGTPVNVGNPDERTVNEIVELVGKAVGTAYMIDRRSLPENDPMQRKPDISRLKSILDGWEPETALEDGIARTARWFEGKEGFSGLDPWRSGLDPWMAAL